MLTHATHAAACIYHICMHACVWHMSHILSLACMRMHMHINIYLYVYVTRMHACAMHVIHAYACYACCRMYYIYMCDTCACTCISHVIYICICVTCMHACEWYTYIYHMIYVYVTRMHACMHVCDTCNMLSHATHATACYNITCDMHVTCMHDACACVCNTYACYMCHTHACMRMHDICICHMHMCDTCACATCICNIYNMLYMRQHA